MRIAVFGATGPTGALIARDAIAAGHDVTVVARTPEKLTLRAARLVVVRGDVFNPDSVRDAVRGHDAVVSSLGVPYGFKPVRVYSEGARSILAAMRESGVRRFVGITSGGTHPGRAPNSSLFFELFLKKLFSNLYDDMRRMEEIVAASDVEWTILRPPRLTNGPRTGRVRRGVDTFVLPKGLTISREDLAAEVLRQLGTDGALRAAVAVAS